MWWFEIRSITQVYIIKREKEKKRKWTWNKLEYLNLLWFELNLIRANKKNKHKHTKKWNEQVNKKEKFTILMWG